MAFFVKSRATDKKVKLTQRDAEWVREQLNHKIDSQREEGLMTKDNRVFFTRIAPSGYGSMKIACGDQQSLDWMVKVVPQLPHHPEWQGFALKASPHGKRLLLAYTCRVRREAWVLDQKQFIDTLQFMNDEIGEEVGTIYPGGVIHEYDAAKGGAVVRL